MIAKIMKGSDFKGVVYYILNDEKGTQIIDADGLFLENNCIFRRIPVQHFR